MKLFLVLATLIFSHNAYSQIDTFEQNYNESKVILGEIQKENHFKTGAFDIRTGLIQVSANKPSDPLKLNARNEMPFVEFTFERRIHKRWGLSTSFLHAQNALGSGTLNDASAFQQMYQIGGIYRVALDETQIKNYVSFKFQYYGMNNNFKLNHPQDFYIQSESGVLLGIERGLPATDLIDIRGSFDFVYITDVKTESILDFKKQGNGLQLKADAFYNLTKVSRLGLGYGIYAFFNKYSAPSFEARDRHTQTYKALYLSYSKLF